MASAKEWRDSIVTVVREITKEAIVPVGDSEVELIWFIQDMTPESLRVGGPPELFKTRGMNENSIHRYHFGGNPLQLLRFLSDSYLKNHLYLIAEAQALACYLLWEAKQYDPTVGKQSDILAFGCDGTTHYMMRDELNYWEEHFNRGPTSTTVKRRSEILSSQLLERERVSSNDAPLQERERILDHCCFQFQIKRETLLTHAK